MAELPEYKRNEGLQPATGNPDFVAAAKQQAAAGNVLTNIGSEVAIRSSVARSELAGIEFGKTPSGDLFPAFNKTDEAFQNAYRTTAQATLALQGEQLLQNALITLSKADKITPALISDFSTSMLKGIEDISAQAPSVDRTSINQTLKLALLKTEGKLNDKLITQQKEEIKDNFMAYSSQTVPQIFDISSAGDVNGATDVFNTFEKNVLAQVESGLLTKTDGQELIKTARINLLTGREYNKAQLAIQNKTIDTWISEWGKNPPEDLSPSEFVSVGENVLKLLSFSDQLEARNQALLVSDGNLARAVGAVGTETLQRFKDEMTPKNYKDLLRGVLIDNQKRANSQNTIQYAMDNWGDAGKFALAENKAVNAAYDSLWKGLQKEYGYDEWTAKALVADSASGAIPDFITEINGKATSGNPQSMNQAFNAMQTLNKNPATLKGLSTDALRTLTHYNVAKLGGVDEITAAQTAVKDVMDFDETKKKARDSNWETIKQEEFGKTSKSLIKKAGEISGIDISKVADDVGFSLMVQNLYEQNYKAIGNKESAKKATQAMLDMSYSETKANGEKEVVYGSLERALNITEQQLPIAWQQIAKQVEQKVKPFNQQYEIGQSDFKYEFKNPVTVDRNTWLDARNELADIYANFWEKARFDIPEFKQRFNDLKMQLKSLELTPNEVIAISNEIERIASEGNFYDVGANLGLSGQTYGFIPKEKTERYKELREMIDAYDNPGRPIISRVFKDGTSQDFYLATYAQDNSDLLNGVPVYDVKLKTMDGQIESFAGAGFFNGKPIIYTPDIDDFNKRFEAQAETAASGGKSSVAEMKRQFEKRSAEAKAFIEKRRKEGLNISSEAQFIEIENSEESEE